MLQKRVEQLEARLTHQNTSACSVPVFSTSDLNPREFNKQNSSAVIVSPRELNPREFDKHRGSAVVISPRDSNLGGSSHRERRTQGSVVSVSVSEVESQTRSLKAELDKVFSLIIYRAFGLRRPKASSGRRGRIEVYV